MTKSARRSLQFVLIMMVLVLPLVFASGALAYPGINSSTEAQLPDHPGQTLRYIYGSAQVYAHEINVTHTGFIHVEMTYGWPDYDCYIYLVRYNAANGIWEQAVNSDGTSTSSQGMNGDFRGKEVIDYFVDGISDEGKALNEAGDDYVGDKYFVLVQSFADVSYFRLDGYFPRTSEVGASTDSPWSFYRARIKYPQDGRTRIYGAPYGGAFKFTPTSTGTAWINTRYPFDPVAKTPTADYTDPTKKLAAFDQYLYSGDWSTAGIWDGSNDPSKPGHWTETEKHGAAPPFVMAPDDTWTRRISAAKLISDDSLFGPNKNEFYIPCLWMVSSDPDQGMYAEPKAGMSTIGYLGSILFPQNLYLNKKAVKLKDGRVHLSGNLTINPIWNDPAGTDGLAWAPADTVVTIQAKVGTGAWKKVGTGKVAGTEGKWATSVKAISGSVKYRALWTGSQMKSISVQYRAKFETAPGSGVYAWSDWATKAFTGPDVALYPGGEFDIVSKSLDPVTGIAFKSNVDLIGGVLLDGSPITKASGVVSYTFDNKPNQPVQIKFGSTNNFMENSLSKTVVGP